MTRPTSPLEAPIDGLREAEADTIRRATTGYEGPLDIGIGGPSPDACAWPAGMTFGFHDEPGEHDPCYVIMPGGAMIAFNHSAEPGVDIARARFVQAACNAALLQSRQANGAGSAEGWKLVPVEPTEAMIAAIVEGCGLPWRTIRLFLDAYPKMLAAAPAHGNGEGER